MAVNPERMAAMKARGAQLRQAWLNANPGKTSKDYTAYVRANIKSKADAARARRASGAIEATLSSKERADAGFARWQTKNPGGTRADYRAYASQRVKQMGDEGFARYQAKNPGATRADYRAYASARVKDMADRAKSRKRGVS